VLIHSQSCLVAADKKLRKTPTKFHHTRSDTFFVGSNSREDKWWNWGVTNYTIVSCSHSSTCWLGFNRWYWCGTAKVLELLETTKQFMDDLSILPLFRLMKPLISLLLHPSFIV
jgi:hypothetical protein